MGRTGSGFATTKSDENWPNLNRVVQQNRMSGSTLIWSADSEAAGVFLQEKLVQEDTVLIRQYRISCISLIWSHIGVKYSFRYLS